MTFLVYQPRQELSYTLTEDDQLCVSITTHIVRTREGFRSGRVEVSYRAEYGFNVDIYDDSGVAWLLWNPPNSGNYVLMRADEL